MSLPLHSHCLVASDATPAVVSARFIPGVNIPAPNPLKPIQDAINTFVRRARQLMLGILIYAFTGLKNGIIYGFVVYHFDPDI